MDLLLDTHTLIWFLSDDFQLHKETKKRIENAELCLVKVKLPLDFFSFLSSYNSHFISNFYWITIFP